MLSTISEVLVKINDLVWGIPLIVFILTTGLILTVKLKGLQIRRLPLAFKYLFSNEKKEGVGEVSSFAALCTALSATIGTGNIVGVATAIVAGGPGALFWMWIAAIIGTATKYSECLLAVKYRHRTRDGRIVGGPFYYIQKGMGMRFKWLAIIFAVFGVGVGLLGIGTFTQINGITNAVNNFFDPKNSWSTTILGHEYSYSVIISGILITIFAAMVILGGIKRISSVAQVVVPFMAIAYVICALLIIGCNITKVPVAINEIIESAFGLRAVTGGALGAMMIAMQKGVARGIFSNEAGLGSSPIAAATASTDEPVRQGLISMTATVIDTIIVCSMTGISIVITGAWDMGLEGVAVTTKAFQMGLPFPDKVSAFLLMTCLVFFAFTTILGWNYYSEKCLEYLIGNKPKALKAYKIIYIIAVFIGPFMTVSAVWTIADILNGLMAIPNLIAVIALSGVVVKETKIYFEKLKK